MLGILSGGNRYFRSYYKYALLAVLLVSTSLVSCGKFNFLGGKSLSIEKLPYVIIPGDPKDPANKIEFHDLFSLNPGQIVPLANYTGGIDSVGTSITDDFDGDGILNANETINNIWVADYPMVEATVAPPVTMQIEILLDEQGNQETFSSEISTDDIEDNIEKGTESVHRNEINTRTVQYQDTMNQSGSLAVSASMNVAVSANVSAMGVSAGASASYGSSLSNSFSSAYGETKNKWKDVPFKDNLGKDSKSLKRTEAAKKSRNLRNEIRTKMTTTTRIKPNAGYIRAALYIKNYSVNMPVRMTNILCSLMLETPDGQLLPVQSFRLRDEDYSIFKVDLYGGDMFGPYVIKLEGLNTYEIKDAISKGCNPKIFIVDYEMTHVTDSNYKKSLSSAITNTNLKIVEENAKGRTASIKLTGPGFRYLFRVAVFSVLDNANQPLNEDRLEPQPAAVAKMSPGVSLEKALTRISYSGLDIEYADYIIDFSGMGEGSNALKIPVDQNNPALGTTARFLVRGVKSVNGKQTKLPIVGEADVTDEQGKVTKAYVMKPIMEWNDGEKVRCGLWVVFDQGRYYRHAGEFGENPFFNALSEVEKDLKNKETFRYTDLETGQTVTGTVPRVQGISGCVWPGDHYDIVYVSMAEMLGIPDKVLNELVGVPDNKISLQDILTQTSSMGTEKKDFGYNPIETEDTTLDFNTRWKSEVLGERPFRPNVNSHYLGTAIEGDTIELELKLNKTKYLNPSFGNPTQVTAARTVNTYTNYSYSMLMDEAIYPFSYDQALDFEISFAIDGRQGDWMNLVPARSPYMETYWQDLAETGAIKYSWDYLDQNFVIRFTVPNDLPGIGDDRVVDIYMRTAPNCAYRESIWPLRHDQVKKFRGRVVSATYDGTSQTTIKTEYNSGEIATGDVVRINNIVDPYTVFSSSYDSSLKQYVIVVTGNVAAQKGDWATVNLPVNLTEPEVQLSVDDGFYTQWNNELSSNPDHKALLTGNTNTSFTPVRSLGYQPDYITGNWLGNNNYGNPFWNNWADAGQWETFLNKIIYPYLFTNSGFSFGLSPYKFGAPSDFLLSTTNTGNQYTVSQCISGDRALVTWYLNDGNNAIHGRIINIMTGERIGNDFIISTTGGIAQQNPQAIISGDRALVVWQSWGDGSPVVIRGRFINIMTGEGIGNDFLVSTTNTTSLYRPILAISGDRVLVVWERYVATGPIYDNYDIYGRLITMSTGAFVGNDFLISNTSADMQYSPQLSIYNDRALIVWESRDNGNYFYIRGRLITMSTGAFVGNDFLVNSTTLYQQYHPQLIMSNDRALVVWRADGIRGRLITISTGAFVGNDFLINTTTSYPNGDPQLGIYNDRALVVWESSISNNSCDIRGRFITISTAEFVGNDFLINNTNKKTHWSYQLGISGNRALVVWDSGNIAGDPTDMYFDIRGRFINMITGVGIGNDFLVSTTSTKGQSSPRIGICGNRALVVWNSYSSYGASNNGTYGGIIDLGISVNSFTHGLSNFFVSPLIERDYTMRVKMIDPLSE